MYVVLADNDRFFKVKDIPYINLNESKESARKSIKESDDDINNTAYFNRVAGELHSWYVCYVEDYERKYEYGFENEKECINWIKKNGFDLDASMIESKKSARKSIKESKDITIEEFISDYKNNDCFSIRDKENGHESECFWGSKKDVLDSDYRLFTVLDTDVNKETDDTILYIDLEENAWVESKKSARKSIKEGRIDKGAVVYEFGCMLNRLGYLCYDYSNESNNEKCDEIVYMIMDLLKTMPKA